MTTEVSRKLAAARTLLILDKPFLGALVLRLPLEAVRARWCPTTATDARKIYYNPDFIEPLNLSQVQFVLAHDALHCGLSHFARREHRDAHRWDIACDHAVNQLLKEDKLEPPEGSLYNDEYAGMAAEEIFPLIPGDSDEQTLDQHLYHGDQRSNSSEGSGDDTGNDTGNKTGNDLTRHSDSDGNSQSNNTGGKNSNNNNAGKKNQPDDTAEQNTEQSDDLSTSNTTRPPPSLSIQEREQLNIQWQQRLAGAAQQASQAGKMTGSAARLINKLLRSSVPWRTLLARYMSGSARVDYNLTRPSQRREGDAIMPSLHARQVNVVVALDTSGSIEQQELDEFVAEVNAIKGLVNARITLLACDAQLDENGPWTFEAWEQLVLPETVQGHGGTDFSPVFTWVSDNNIQPDLVIYFTDAQGRFPQKPPLAETLWLVKGPANIPWGQRIQLN